MPLHGRSADMPFSSLARSVEAYQPYYAPPVTPVSAFIDNTSALSRNLEQVASRVDYSDGLVTRAPRLNGIRTLFSYGTQILTTFRMIATGRVESTTFQPRLSHQWVGEFNDSIYQAGYPRNLGLTVKVPTVNPNINPPWSMTPAPQFRRNIFVNRRATTSGVPGLPAKPTQGMYS
jgi:hypothetical protein